MMADQTSGPVLLGKHLARAFGQGETRTLALNDVSIELDRGQVSLLMGPSGSGKSTLLAVLSGLLRPDAGQVLALGQDIWAMSERQQALAEAILKDPDVVSLSSFIGVDGTNVTLNSGRMLIKLKDRSQRAAVWYPIGDAQSEALRVDTRVGDYL